MREVAVCAAHPVMQAAAALCGADEVYAMGGAQAIAALAYGTESVAPVDVIVGPGSLYAQEAKRQVFGRVGIDGFAGPSDLVVIATDGADPQVALDALAQAEHGAGSAVAVCRPDAALLEAARAGDPVPALLALVTPTPTSALAFSEAFAPEHLQLCGAGRGGARAAGAPRRLRLRRHRRRHRVRRLRGGLEPRRCRRRARRASRPGSTCATSCARWPSSRSAAEAAAALAPAGVAIAHAEGFTAHAASMEARMDART